MTNLLTAVKAMRVVGLVALLGAAVMPASAAEADSKSYAVLSLVGDHLTTIGERTQTGTTINQNDRNVVALTDKMFDEAAIKSANATIKKSWPATQTTMLITPDPGLYKAQNAMFDAPLAHADDRAFLKSLLTARKVSHLILITKARADTEIRLENWASGTGTLEGLGFYVDNMTELKSATSLKLGKGFIAPYAYLKVRLIDANTLEVLREVVQKKTVPMGNYNRESLSAWDVYSAKQKIEQLQDVLEIAVRDAVGKLIQ